MFSTGKGKSKNLVPAQSPNTLEGLQKTVEKMSEITERLEREEHARILERAHLEDLEYRTRKQAKTAEKNSKEVVKLARVQEERTRVSWACNLSVFGSLTGTAVSYAILHHLQWTGLALILGTLAGFAIGLVSSLLLIFVIDTCIWKKAEEKEENEIALNR